MLRIHGADLDPDAVMNCVSIEATAIHRKGEPIFRSKPSRGTKTSSSVTYLASDADFSELERQQEDAIAFLQRYGDDIKQALATPGCEGGTLDFGIDRRDVAVQCDYFPPELIALAGKLGLGIELTQYPPSSDEDGTEDATEPSA